MAKPETYKGADGVKIKCLRDYTVKAGSGAHAGEDEEYKAGTTYTVAPRTAAHMLRKVYATYDKPKGDERRGKYLGDANFFEEAKAASAKKTDD